jgi:hypothetical protein
VNRQGQKQRVKYFRLEGTNSAIDQEMVLVQMKKYMVNDRLLEPLTRCHHEDPADIELYSGQDMPDMW